MIVTQCRLCTSEDLVKILDLGFHPLADFFPKEHQLMQGERRYPLSVLLCRSCGHAMTGFVVSPVERYQENDYSFNSNHSKISIQHFTDIATKIASVAGLAPDDLVVDVGSNVGTLLTAFKHLGAQVLGVDPSPNIARIAEESGIPTLNDFFGLKACTEILKKGRPKVVTFINCFNHIAALDEVMRGVTSILREDGILVIESPYFLQLLQRMQFDTVYHEHLSYLAVKPISLYMKKFGLTVMHAEEDDYIGGVIRFFIGRGEEHSSVKELIAKEEKVNLFDENTFEPYAQKVLQCKLELLRELVEAKSRGGKIVAIGAAAKGNTLLNYCGIDTGLVDFVTDVSPLKIGKYMSGSHIPIRSDDAIDDSITHAFLISWNLADFLKGKIGPKHPKLQFITPHVVAP